MDERIQKLLDTYRTQGSVSTGQIGDVISNFPASDPIGTRVLNGFQKPYSLPNVQTSTTAEGLSGLSSAVSDQAKQSNQLDQEQAQKEAIAQSKYNESKAGYQNLVDQITGIFNSKNKLEADNKISEKTQKVTDVTNQIDALDRAQTNELRALETANMSDAGRGATSAEINRKYAFQKADLALIQSAANRDLATAQNIVDRKIQLQLEPLKFQLDYVKDFYNQNKTDLTKEEDRAFNLKVKEVEKQYDEQKTLQETIGKLQVQAATQGASPEIIQSIGRAKSIGDAVGSAGIYAGDILEKQKKQLEILKLNKEIQALGVPTITNPQAGQYSAALNTILGSGTFTKDQKATIINAVNYGQDPFSVIKNQAKNIMGQTLATTLDKNETAKAQLQNIDSLLKQYYANGGTTNLFSGSYEKTLNKLGEVNDPTLVEIATNISSALQIYRNAVSGTAYSVQEGKEISSVFPGINKTQGLNQSIINGRVKAFDTTIDSQYRNTLGSSYDTLKKAETAQQAQDANIPYMVVPQNQIPEGYYQASDGKFYKK